jgi:hypothetical protein
MSLKDTKNSVAKIKLELTKSIEVKNKSFQSLLVKNAKAHTKAQDDLKKSNIALKSAKDATTKKKVISNIKSIEKQLKEIMSVSLFLKGAEQHLKNTLKSAKAAIKAQAQPKKANKKVVEKKKPSKAVTKKKVIIKTKKVVKKSAAKKKPTAKTKEQTSDAAQAA